MIQETDAKKIIDQARNYAQGKCQSIEITVNANNVATSRFANNEMTQNQAPEVLDLSIRVSVGSPVKVQLLKYSA